jgi:Thioredoxin like C-terminal domain
MAVLAGLHMPSLSGSGVLRDGRLYQLVREHDAVRERTLQITFLEAGAEAYVVTFG